MDEQLYQMVFKRKSFHIFKNTLIISEEELAAVSGGKLFERSCPEAGQEADGWCFCILPGGGGGTMLDDGAVCGCACVGYGQGGDAKDDHWVCYCTAMGCGC